MKFINREKELALLESEHKSSDFSFCVLYGRRRVGKTTLLKEFSTSKSVIYFLCDMENEKILTRRFQSQVAEYFRDTFFASLQLESFEQVLEYMAQREFADKLVLIIDEYQYLASTNSSISSVLQRIIDTKLKSKNLFLILCGSIISMMYNETLSYTSPLFGRRTSQIRLESIDFANFAKFYPKKNEIELVELYSVLYGVPKYIEIFGDNKDLFVAIEKNILSKNSYLYEEPKFILNDEVSDATTYFTILEIISSGEHKLGNIAGKLGKNVQNITSFLQKLIDLELVYRDVPITEENPVKSKRGLYFIRDNFFRFWFRFVLPYKSYLEIGNTSYVLEKIKNSFNEFVSFSYENVCKEYLQKNPPFEFERIGRWWDGKDELDIVVIGANDIMFCECKWSEKMVGIDILEQLIDVSKKIDTPKNRHYALFSKSGFTETLLNKARESDRVLLIHKMSVM